MKGKASEEKPGQPVRKTSRARRKASAIVSEVTVTFRHVAPTDAIREYAERKLKHIGARLKRSCSVHLILTVDKYRHQGEVTVKCGRFDLTAQEETKDLYAVIDLLADKVGRQLKCHLAKVETRRVRAPSTGEVLSFAEDSSNAEELVAGPDTSRF